jgi:hypothetical protein
MNYKGVLKKLNEFLGVVNSRAYLCSPKNFGKNIN